MFSPPKRQTIIAVLVALATTALATEAMSQNSEFERRSAAMRRARSRSIDTTIAPVAYAQSAAKSKTAAVEMSPRPVSGSPKVRRVASTGRPAAANRRVAASKSNRKPARVAQLIHGTDPIIAGSVVQGEIVGSSYAGGDIISHGPVGALTGGSSHRGQIYDNVVGEHVIHDDIYGGETYLGDHAISGDCGCDASVGFQCGAGESCSSGCCGRGGCADGPCWLGSFGKALRTGEYFGGAVGFQSPLFTSPGQNLPINPDDLASDSSFGAYGGFNLGIPLCRLSCGFLSGQFGIRSVNTNFNGNEFSPEDRRQIFVTTGLYRRVDQGLQFGVVADILHEEWFTETDLVQIRSDIGWVYPAGHTFGFRYATGVQDEETDGAFNGQQFTNFFQTTDDNYRFYYRHQAPWGGWGEVFAGWAEASQTIVGVDVDLPVTETISFQSGFTALLNDDVVSSNSTFQGGNLNEGWNLFVGVSFKPQGRSWYRSYDRPLFSVADNGTFLIRRQSPEIQ